MKSIALAASSAQAADPGCRCRRFSGVTVSQEPIHPGYFHGAKVRSNADGDRHYSWRLRAVYDVARTEEGLRGGQLHACNMEAYGHA